jgi:trk system potassium uptake protein TrkA
MASTTRRVVVIGLGIFGSNIVKELYENGFEVIAVDKDKDAVQRLKDFATKAIVANGTDNEIIDQIGVQEDDVVIISFGEDLAASTLITLHLKKMKVKNIIVKAPNEEHKLILEKVGATDVIIPEKEVASKVAKSLISPSVLDCLPLSEGYMIFEIAPPNSFLGKSIGELELRNRYHIEVIAVKDVLTDQVHMVPAADFILKDGEILVVIAKEKDIQKIK